MTIRTKREHFAMSGIRDLIRVHCHTHTAVAAANHIVSNVFDESIWNWMKESNENAKKNKQTNKNHHPDDKRRTITTFGQMDQTSDAEWQSPERINAFHQLYASLFHCDRCDRWHRTLRWQPNRLTLMLTRRQQSTSIVVNLNYRQSSPYLHTHHKWALKTIFVFCCC